MKMPLDCSLENANSNSTKGTIIIVDISGFTQLVYKTSLMEGKAILRKLLSCIIEKNQLGLRISEIEGDAILFYQFGTPPPYQLVLDQFRIMNNHFLGHVDEINEELGNPLALALKMIVHYGPIAQYQMAGFSKLFGRTVLESHLLLKNEVKSHSYVLLTNDFLHNTSFDQYDLNHYQVENEQCEILRGVKRLCYRSLDFSSGMYIAS